MAGPEFKEGDKVTLWPLGKDEAYAAHTGGVAWYPENDELSRDGVVIEVLRVYVEAGGHQAIYGKYIHNGPQQDWFQSAWCVPYGTVTDFVIPPCVCIGSMAPCTCGSMEAEMRAKGMWKNPVTKMWEKRKE